MADQVSLPNIARPDIRGFLGTGLWTGTRRNLLGRDVHEQLGILEPEDGLVLWYRLLEQFLVAALVQRVAALRRRGGPACEVRLRDDVDVEHHVRKTVAGEMRREA